MKCTFNKKPNFVSDSGWVKIASGWTTKRDGSKIKNGGMQFKVGKGVDVTLKEGSSIMVFPNKKREGASDRTPTLRMSVNIQEDKKAKTKK